MLNKKGYIELLMMLIMVSVFGMLFFSLFAHNQKKAEIIKQKYGYDCNFITVRACADMLKFEEGENKDYTLEIK